MVNNLTSASLFNFLTIHLIPLDYSRVNFEQKFDMSLSQIDPLIQLVHTELDGFN